MIWKKFTIDTTTAAVDFISQALSEEGVEGIEIEDNMPLTKGDIHDMFIEEEPEIFPTPLDDDGKAKVHFYLDGSMTTTSLEKMLDNIKCALTEVAIYVDAGPLTITVGESDEEDWLNNWKQYFHPFTIDDVLIKPTWEMIPEGMEDKLLIAIDPGAAFGTGTHETTKLCVRAVRKYVSEGDRVLDVGTGSGILGIIALKSGASFVLGTDLDPSAVQTAKENADVNLIPEEKFEVVLGNIIDDEDIKKKVGGEYDLVVANILAPAIILLQNEIPNHIKDGGIFIVSGIIDTKEKEVKEAFEKNNLWEYVETAHEGEWVSITYKKR